MNLQISCRKQNDPATENLESTSLWVEVFDGRTRGFGESVISASPVQETFQRCEEIIAVHKDTWIQKIQSSKDLIEWVENNSDFINQNSTTWCAVELAFLDFLGKNLGQPVENFFGIPINQKSLKLSPSYFSRTLTISKDQNFSRQFRSLLSQGYRDFSIEIDSQLPLMSEEIRDSFQILKKHLEDESKKKLPISIPSWVIPKFKKSASKTRIRLNARNKFKSVIDVFNFVKKCPISFSAIEEPVSVGDAAALSRISTELNIPILLDRSLSLPRDFELFANLPGIWIPKVSLSKWGGVVRTLKAVEFAKMKGWKLCFGGHKAQTSLLTRATILVAEKVQQMNPKLFFAMEEFESPFLAEQDYAHPTLNLSRNEKIDFRRLQKSSGWGLDMQAPEGGFVRSRPQSPKPKKNDHFEESLIS
jgi:L-alanine-DL-glutamate epimerase-like enolase superfamily enzyme